MDELEQEKTMQNENIFKSWAIVEVMGHVTYSGFVSAEVIAGKSMLRVDVPAVAKMDGYTKYISPDALYGITPVSEETARARADTLRAVPFDCWSIEEQVKRDMRERGLLIESKADEEVLPWEEG